MGKGHKQKNKSGGKKKGGHGVAQHSTKARAERRRTKTVSDAEFLKAHEGAERHDQTLGRMRVKVLERKLQRGLPKEEAMDAHRSLALLHAAAMRNKKALEEYDKLFKLDPADSLSCAAHYLTLLMDDAQSDKARQVLDRFPALRNTTIGAYTLALLEYLSSAVLEEEGSDWDEAVRLLKAAQQINPFCAEFLAFQDQFTERFDPGLVDETLGWTPAESPMDAALQYAATYGQVSVWADVEGAAQWLHNTIFGDDEYNKEGRPIRDIEEGGGDQKFIRPWREARDAAMDAMLASDSSMSDADSAEGEGTTEAGGDEIDDSSDGSAVP